MTKRRVKGKAAAALGPHERHAFDGLAFAVTSLREVSRALLDDAIDGDGMQKAVDAYFVACDVAMGPPDEAVDLALLLDAGEAPGVALGAYLAERALLGRPIALRERDSGQMLPFIPADLDEISAVLEEIDRLDPRVRAERYLADEHAAALAVGMQLARDGANEIFPLKPWTAPVYRRCLAVAAIVAATRAAMILNIEEDADDLEEFADHEEHERKHGDLSDMVHVAAAAVDALDDEEREDVASPNFGVISHLVEDLLITSGANIEPTLAHALSATLTAAFMRGFDGGPPAPEIVHSDDQDIAQILAAADLAGHLAADRLMPHVEPDSPYATPRPLIH